MTRRREFGKRCQLCNRNRVSRIFPRPVRGKWRRLCLECWILELRESEKDANDRHDPAKR